MPRNKLEKRPAALNRDQRKRRTQQLIFNAIAIIVIVAWIVSLLVKF